MMIEHTIYKKLDEIAIQAKTITDNLGNGYILYQWENADMANIDYNDLSYNQAVQGSLT